MSFFKESLYILLVGCIIYLSMFLWGSYQTSVDRNQRDGSAELRQQVLCYETNSEEPSL